jgi:hypothetical protein
LETSTALAGETYAMKISAVPSVDRLRAISDLELKLVLTRDVGIAGVLTAVPTGVI